MKGLKKECVEMTSKMHGLEEMIGGYILFLTSFIFCWSSPGTVAACSATTTTTPTPAPAPTFRMTPAPIFLYSFLNKMQSMKCRKGTGVDERVAPSQLESN